MRWGDPQHPPMEARGLEGGSRDGWAELEARTPHSFLPHGPEPAVGRDGAEQSSQNERRGRWCEGQKHEGATQNKGYLDVRPGAEHSFLPAHLLCWRWR